MRVLERVPELETELEAEVVGFITVASLFEVGSTNPGEIVVG